MVARVQWIHTGTKNDYKELATHTASSVCLSVCLLLSSDSDKPPKAFFTDPHVWTQLLCLVVGEDLWLSGSL